MCERISLLKELLIKECMLILMYAIRSKLEELHTRETALDK